MMMEKIMGNTIPGEATGELPHFACFIQGSPIAVNKAKIAAESILIKSWNVIGAPPKYNIRYIRQ